MQKIITLDLPTELDRAEIYPLSDLHIGDKYADLNLFRKFRDHVLAAENRFIVCIGDLANNAVKSSVSNVYNETISPREQRKWLKENLAPLADRIVVMVGGNHEERSLKDTDTDITEELADSLRIPKAYRSNEAVVKVTLGKGYNGKKICYLLYCIHGTGGGKKPGASINNMLDLGLSIDCDIYIMGHTHKKTAHKNTFRRVDTRNNRITDEQERLFITTSSYTAFGGYAARGMMIPSAKGSVPVTLSGVRKELFATV